MVSGDIFGLSGWWVEATVAAQHHTSHRAAARDQVTQPKMLTVPGLRDAGLASPLQGTSREDRTASLSHSARQVTVVPNLTPTAMFSH